MTAKRSGRQAEPLTIGDRLVTALVGGLCGFGTMLVVWLAASLLGGRRGLDESLPFSSTGIGAALAAAFGFLVGPERMMDSLEWVWWLLGGLLGHGHGPNPTDRRQGRF